MFFHSRGRWFESTWILISTTVFHILLHYILCQIYISEVKLSDTGNCFAVSLLGAESIDDKTKEGHVLATCVVSASSQAHIYKEEQKKIALVSWEKICLPKRKGGLNVKGSSNWNIASVGQLLWQIVVNKESLWLKWIHGIYIKTDASIWTHKVPTDCSWYWKKLNGIKILMQGWYNQGRYMLTQFGNYSITRSYLALMGYRPKMRTAELIWTSMALPKHRFMVWLAIQGRLLTQERKVRMNIPVEDVACCMCDEQVMETTVHLFEECKWTLAVWHEINQWTRTTIQINGITRMLDKIKVKHWVQFKKEIMAAICGAALYHTWRARNWKKFKGRNVYTEEVVLQIKKEVIGRLSLLNKSKQAHKCRDFIQHLLCN